MYRAYKIDINEIQKLPDIHVLNAYNFQETKPSPVQHPLSYYIKNNGFFDDQKIIETFFPELKYPKIFLSHSGKNHKDVLLLKYWFEIYYDLETFVDSTIWNRYQDFVAFIKQHYPNVFENKSEQMEKCILNIQMVLLCSLHRMIDYCNYFILVSSTDSVLSEITTKSPWIFYELFTANSIQIKYTESRIAEYNSNESLSRQRIEIPSTEFTFSNDRLIELHACNLSPGKDLSKIPIPSWQRPFYYR